MWDPCQISNPCFKDMPVVGIQNWSLNFKALGARFIKKYFNLFIQKALKMNKKLDSIKNR